MSVVESGRIRYVPDDWVESGRIDMYPMIWSIWYVPDGRWNRVELVYASRGLEYTICLFAMQSGGIRIRKQIFHCI